jgi:RNA polymerase sigma-70 factor (ECF subfamily)
MSTARTNGKTGRDTAYGLSGDSVSSGMAVPAPDPGPHGPAARPAGTPTESSRTELLVRLLSRHQEQLFRYIFTLLPHEEDARDVLQETSVALYRKFSDYDPEKPFLPWAYRFAYLEVLKQRERNQRGSKHLSRDLLDRLAREREQLEPVLEARLQALELCLRDLSAGDQDLIRRRYQEKNRTDELVRSSGASRRTFFRRLDRIRRHLWECINRRVAAMDMV